MILRFVNKLKSFSADERFAEIFKGSVFSLGSRVIATLLSLITSILVARLYGAEVVGVLAIINAFLTLVTIFTVLGTGTSILRLIPEHVAKFSVSSAYHIYRKVQYLVTGVSLVSGALFIAVSGIVADKLFGKSHLSSYFALAAGFVVFKALADLGTQAVRGLRLIRTFAIMQVLPQAAMLLFLLVSIVLCNCPEAPVYAQLGAFAPVAVSGIWIMEHSFRCRMAPMDTVHPVSVREVLSISTPMLMTASMQFFIGQTGVVLLGVFRSEAEVGYYSIAVKLATLTTFILQAVNSMAAPKFSELFHSGRIDDLFYVANKTANLIFWVSVPVLFGLILFGKAILYFLFGPEFIIAYPALLVLILGQFVSCIAGSCGNLMNMAGHQLALRNIIVVSSLTNIFLNFFLIPSFGIIGAAVTATICTVFINIRLLLFIKGKYGRTTGFLPLLNYLNSLWLRTKK